MNYRRVRTVVLKEWIELTGQKMVVATIALVPLAFVAVAVSNLMLMNRLPEPSDPLPQNLQAMCDGLEGIACVRAFTAQMFYMMFMILPSVIPSTIAAYSVVGEKSTRTLEPLLATPVRTAELLAAKAIAAIVPGVLSTWFACGLWVSAVAALSSHEVLLRVFAVKWLLAIGVVGPLVAVFSTLFGLMVSSRVNDPRAAQQIAGLLVLPLVGLVMAQIFGLVAVSSVSVLGIAAVISVLDAAAAWLALQVFDREAILTRWK